MEQDKQNPSPYWERPSQYNSQAGNTPGQNGQNPGPYWERPQHQLKHSKEEPTNGLATAAMVLGILALIGIFTIYPAIILGSLSIILALLSRGQSLKMHGQAKTGVITSVIAIGCGVALFAMVFALILGMPDFFENIYGMSYQEMMEQMEDGTLDYEELYDNIYDNLEEMYE